MITERDRKALGFVREAGVATTYQIQRVAYAGGKYAAITARKRLAFLAKSSLLKRVRGHSAEEYLYWMEGKAPKQTDHSLLVTEFYVRLMDLPGKIETWEREPDWGRLRPDAFCELSRGPLHYLFAVEAQRITGNPFNQDKYEQYYASGEWRKHWPKFPRVIVITDRPPKITTTNIMFIILPSSLEGVETIF
jgi:hypothetical protein